MCRSACRNVQICHKLLEMTRKLDVAYLGPRPVKIPCRLCGANYVITPLDNGTRNVPNFVHVVQDPSLPFEKSTVMKVVFLSQSRKRQRHNSGC